MLNEQIQQLEERLGKKRDELREMIEEFEPLIASATEALDEVDLAISHLQEAKNAVVYATELASQYA